MKMQGKIFKVQTLDKFKTVFFLRKFEVKCAKKKNKKPPPPPPPKWHFNPGSLQIALWTTGTLANNF